MKRIGVAVVFLCLLAGCGGGNDGGGSTSSDGSIPISIGTSGVCVTINELCASVTICQPGTNNCQTISDVLVDVGSVGLRVFGSRLSVPLTQTVDAQGRALGECTFFADGSTSWGAVQIADVVLGGAPAVHVRLRGRVHHGALLRPSKVLPASAGFFMGPPARAKPQGKDKTTAGIEEPS